MTLYFLDEYGAALGAIELDQRVQALGSMEDLHQFFRVERDGQRLLVVAITHGRDHAGFAQSPGEALSTICSGLHFQLRDVHNSSKITPLVCLDEQ